MLNRKYVKTQNLKGFTLKCLAEWTEEVIIRNKDHIIRLIDRDPILEILKVKRMTDICINDETQIP